MGYLHCLYVCNNLHHLYWITSDQMFYEIEVWHNLTVEFRGSWILKAPGSTIFGFILEFIFVWMQPISNAHILSLVPCLHIYFDILLLEDSYEALLTNITIKSFISALSNCFFKVVTWYGFTAASISSIQRPKFDVSFINDGSVTDINLISLLL